MKNKLPQRGLRYLILTTLILGVMILDQASKAFVHHHMRLHESIEILEGFFAITYIRNPGAAFGFLATLSDGLRFYFFATVSVVALISLGVFFYRTRPDEPWTVVGIALVGGGAFGNLIDRLRLGEVIDFLDFYIGAYHWPAFNVADSAISIGLALLVLQLFVHSRKDVAKGHLHLLF